MRVLLAAINSKYIHSNLAVYSLKAYHDRHSDGSAQVEIAEYTINQPADDIIADIYRRNPEVVAFSCYIWNIRYVYEIVKEVKKICPYIKIWLGGPEVSFDGAQILSQHQEIEGIMCGEGEMTFSKLANSRFDTQACMNNTDFRGIVYRNNGKIYETLPVTLMNMDELPFVYQDLEPFRNKIIYYESSRGCPFRCSYCLSSVDRQVRFRSLSLVFGELQYFLDNNVTQVKFVDRTFNCNHERTMKLLEFIKEHDNGVTNFHFEIAADLLMEDEITLLSSLRPGLVQLEIGVQSTNTDTIKDINRVMDFRHLSEVVTKLNMGKNVHLHLDLIAGLPDEDMKSFHKSFNDVISLEPEQLQLGFLKVLNGSPMKASADRYELVYKSQPPYEVMKTKWISYDEILHLKEIEDMVEIYYNSGQYQNTIRELIKHFEDAFVCFEALAGFYSDNNLWGVKHSRISRYEIMYHFIMQCVKDKDKTGFMKELLIFDLYLRENLKSRPVFAEGTDSYKNVVRKLYTACEAPRTAHIERFSSRFGNWAGRLDEIAVSQNIFSEKTFSGKNFKNQPDIDKVNDYTWILFQYETRDALNFNCVVHRIRIEEEGIKA